MGLLGVRGFTIGNPLEAGEAAPVTPKADRNLFSKPSKETPTAKTAANVFAVTIKPSMNGEKQFYELSSRDIFKWRLFLCFSSSLLRRHCRSGDANNYQSYARGNWAPSKTTPGIFGNKLRTNWKMQFFRT